LLSGSSTSAGCGVSVRRHEFAIALLAAAAVVVLGVQDGIVLAVAASIIDHPRNSYHPFNSTLVKSPAGHWQVTRSGPAPGPRKALWSAASAPACN
jgi:MFS superfamily sulfate permease-like transporter